MEPHCLGWSADYGRSGCNNRLFMEAVPRIARTGSPWRDLSDMFAIRSTPLRRSSDWHETDVFERIFDALSDEPSMEYAMVNATIVKVHRNDRAQKSVSEARRRKPIPREARNLRMTAFDQKLLLQDQRVQAYRHARLQSRSMPRSIS